ncbi:polyphosphate polymerase domain-containing protein [Symbioplanes lichenis]|uniref:polyphosphate polymerase domain-containing protein n=1 Tax=Symbioplanes lichenis TaxID=1629072 RepID=UPI0027382567|nr:polyphosphate polymerase domain-containing protein [Actinoplanes lichenis]
MMPAIGLAELIELAELQTRVDRKYAVPRATVGVLLDHLAGAARVLEIDGLRSFRYHSVYFDTDDLTSYRLAAYQRRRRFKIRTRTYLDSASCWLEVKTEGARGGTVKERRPYRTDHHATVAPGRSFVDDRLKPLAIPGHTELTFAPTLVTRYRRTTLCLPATGSRVTVDVDLAWESGGRRLGTPHLAVIETKTGSVPSPADRLLWALGHRPVRISKYATGLAALRPDLPCTPWRRTLRRHFTAAGAPIAPAGTSWLSTHNRQD